MNVFHLHVTLAKPLCNWVGGFCALNCTLHSGDSDAASRVHDNPFERCRAPI